MLSSLGVIRPIKKKVYTDIMPKASDTYNLGVMNPGLAKEWHPTRNGNLNPRNVTPGSGKKVWWICKNGHEWEAAVYSRNRGSGCPVCNRPATDNNQETLISNTDLVKEWHLTKNSGLNLRHLPPGFKNKVWWICEEGHEWKATVNIRMKGHGCPECSKAGGRKGTPGINRVIPYQRKRESAQDRDSQRPSFLQHSAATGFRKNKRFLHRATVILEVCSNQRLQQ